MSAPFMAAAIGTGAGQYGFGILIEPLEETFGWTRSEISFALSFTVFGGLIAPLLGWTMDRYGARVIIAVSLAMIAASLLLRPLMTDLWHFYALSLFQYIGYTGASMLSAGKLVGIWFQRTRGRAMGLTAMGHNFGGLVVPPLMGALLTLFAWQGTYVGLGILTGLLVLYTLVVVRDFPTGEDVKSEFVAAAGGKPPAPTGWTVFEALRERTFYALTLAVVMGTFTYSTVLPHLIPHLTNSGASLAVATTVLSVFAIFGMLGKFIMGYLAERITSRYALMINFVGHSAMLAVITLFVDPVVIWIAVPLFGIFHGAFGALFQLVVQDAFGVRYFGGIMGVVNLTTMVSFGVGPILAGQSFDITGSYDFAFLAVAVMFATGAIALTQARSSSDRLATRLDPAQSETGC